MSARMVLVLPALLSLALGGCSVQSRLPGIIGGADTSREFSVRWSRGVGAVKEHFIPALSGGMICFADATGEALLLDPDDGGTAESFEMDFDSGKLSASVGCGDGVVVAMDHEGKAAAYDDEGAELWRADLRARALSPPTVSGGRVFLRTASLVSARALRKGDELWRYENPLGGNLHVRVESGALADGDAVFAGFGEGAVVALRASNGETLWENTVDEGEGEEDGGNVVANIREVTTPLRVRDYVCAGAYQGAITCFNAEFGEVEWRRPFSTVVKLAADAEGRRLFAVSERGELFAFDAETGEELWKNGDAFGASAPLVVGDAVVVGGSDGAVRAFAADDGKLLARKRLGVGIVPRLVAAGEEGDFLATVESGYFLGDGLARLRLEAEE